MKSTSTDTMSALDTISTHRLVQHLKKQVTEALAVSLEVGQPSREAQIEQQERMIASILDSLVERRCLRDGNSVSFFVPVAAEPVRDGNMWKVALIDANGERQFATKTMLEYEDAEYIAHTVTLRVRGLRQYNEWVKRNLANTFIMNMSIQPATPVEYVTAKITVVQAPDPV